MNIRISTDSTADIPRDLCEKWNIRVVPLTILCEGKEYRDGVDIEPYEFYRILDAAETLPVSSQVAVEAYIELFEEMYAEKCTDLIHVSINSKGSGTYQAGLLARGMFYESHPEAESAFRIHLVDSLTYSMSYGLAVIEAAQMAAKGASPEEILAVVDDWVAHSRPLFVPLDLKCVKKSGRVSAAAAFMGDALGLKPLITFEDGESRILTKIRGKNKVVSTLVERCLSERKPGSSYAIVYGNNDEMYRQLKAACAEKLDIPPLTDYLVGCIIAINTGPNMIGLIYRT